jgi:hypothetical protein
LHPFLVLVDSSFAVDLTDLLFCQATVLSMLSQEYSHNGTSQSPQGLG